MSQYNQIPKAVQYLLAEQCLPRKTQEEMGWFASIVLNGRPCSRKKVGSIVKTDLYRCFRYGDVAQVPLRTLRVKWCAMWRAEEWVNRATTQWHAAETVRGASAT